MRGDDGSQGRGGPPGAPGTPGLPGRDGDQGQPGAQGKMGAEGPRGPSGPRGQKGEKGLPGLPGDYDGDRGPAGPQGDCGPQGEQGPPGLPGQNLIDPFGNILEDIESDIADRLMKVIEGEDYDIYLESFARRVAPEFCNGCTPTVPTTTTTSTTSTTTTTTTSTTTTTTTTTTTRTTRPPTIETTTEAQISPQCSCSREVGRDLTIFLDNSESVTSLGVDVSKQISSSVADLVEEWAQSNTNENSVAIVTQFSARLRHPIYEKTAAEYKTVGQAARKAELQEHLLNIITTPYGDQVALASDLSQDWQSWETEFGQARTEIAGTTFFFTTLKDLVNYAERTNNQDWVHDRKENMLVVITGRNARIFFKDT